MTGMALTIEKHHQELMDAGDLSSPFKSIEIDDVANVGYKANNLEHNEWHKGYHEEENVFEFDYPAVIIRYTDNSTDLFTQSTVDVSETTPQVSVTCKCPVDLNSRHTTTHEYDAYGVYTRKSYDRRWEEYSCYDVILADGDDGEVIRYTQGPSYHITSVKRPSKKTSSNGTDHPNSGRTDHRQEYLSEYSDTKMVASILDKIYRDVVNVRYSYNHNVFNLDMKSGKTVTTPFVSVHGGRYTVCMRRYDSKTKSSITDTYYGVIGFSVGDEKTRVISDIGSTTAPAVHTVKTPTDIILKTPEGDFIDYFPELMYRRVGDSSEQTNIDFHPPTRPSTVETDMGSETLGMIGGLIANGVLSVDSEDYARILDSYPGIDEFARSVESIEQLQYYKKDHTYTLPERFSKNRFLGYSAD